MPRPTGLRSPIVTYAAHPDRYTRTEYARVGRSGLLLPRISLGLWNNFGDDRPFATQRDIVLRAFDLGVTHFDLANNYGPPYGSAETNFGRLLSSDLRPYRDEIIVSSKAGYDMWPGPYGDHGSRKYLLSSLDQSLTRLGLDYVDIFYHHRPDSDTPIEESMGALAHAVRSGKALYVGISNYGPEDTRRAQAALAAEGVPLLIHQPRYNMFDRKPEEGLLDTITDLGIGSIVFSPLAGGLLTDRYLHGVPADSRAAVGRWITASNITEVYLDRARAVGCDRGGAESEPRSAGPGLGAAPARRHQRADRRVERRPARGEPGRARGSPAHGRRSLRHRRVRDSRYRGPMSTEWAESAPTPPMGWNSWDSYGTTVTEDEVLANARVMRDRLLPLGWDTVVVDIAWYDPLARAHGYNEDAPVVLDAHGRLMPVVERFPSAAGGAGFGPLATAIHEMGLKFGIHVMRGIPRRAVHEDLPIEGTPWTARDVVDREHVCAWNPDNFGLNHDHPGAQLCYDAQVTAVRRVGHRLPEGRRHARPLPPPRDRGVQPGDPAQRARDDPLALAGHPALDAAPSPPAREQPPVADLRRPLGPLARRRGAVRDGSHGGRRCSRQADGRMPTCSRSDGSACAPSGASRGTAGSRPMSRSPCSRCGRWPARRS